MKKTVFLVVLALVLFTGSFTLVSAVDPYFDIIDTEDVQIDLTVPKRDSRSSESIVPDENIVFSITEITLKTGNAQYDAVYETQYGTNNWLEIGRINNLSSTEDLVFEPYYGVLSGFGTEKDQCSGTNTSSYNCMIDSEYYRMTFQNDNFFYSFTIEGVFYGYE